MASVQEHARQLLELADDAPAAEVEALVQTLQAWGQRASVILGDTTAKMIIMSEVQSAITVCDQLSGAIEILRQAAKEHAERYLSGGN
jgi:hypothetical protein